ncbi:DUF982 domain-containing protein [Mesorhizobium sp. M0088]
MSSRFVRPVVVQVGRHDRERIIFDVNDAATILLRSFPHQTNKRKLAMDACLQVRAGRPAIFTSIGDGICEIC